MSARKFLRRASKQVRHFWQRLSCTSRSNTAVEEIAEDLADNDVDIVSVPVIPAVHQSASFSAARFAPMPLLPGEVPSSRCRSVMGDWNQYRPVHTVNRLVNTTRARHDARGHVRVQVTCLYKRLRYGALNVFWPK